MEREGKVEEKEIQEKEERRKEKKAEDRRGELEGGKGRERWKIRKYKRKKKLKWKRS